MMPQVGRIARILRDPLSIPEKLIERRMTAAALSFYRRRTEAENDAERGAFFKPIADVRAFVDEARGEPVLQRIAAAGQSDDAALQIAASQTTGVSDCITMYVMVRLWQPQIMVETGVFYGAMSAMILAAMRRNGGGRLYSIDLPVAEFGLPEHLRGGLVPADLRPNWELILGDSRVELPRLLARLGEIDAFNHDSLHTTRHMTWEFETAWWHIKSGGWLSSHDVLMTPSWSRFCRAHAGEIDHAGRVYALGIAHKRA